MDETNGAFREEIDEILADTNKTTDEAAAEILAKANEKTDERAVGEYFDGTNWISADDSKAPDPLPDDKDAAEYFGDPLPGWPGDPIAAPPHPQATLMLEKIRIGLSTYVSRSVLDQMKFEQKYDPVTDKIMMELGMYLFSNKIHTETTKGDYPAGWFQGFKDAHFPGWLKRKFPVKYTQFFEEVKTVHICPHLNYRTRDEEKFHLQFLMPEGDLTRINS